MEIDTTLDEILIPALPTYQNEFGTKKDGGGLSTAECADFIMRPFRVQRPFVVTENSETKEIQRNCSFLISSSDITLTLKDATFVGCEISVINISSGNITIEGGASGINGSTASLKVPPKTCVNLVFCTGWQTFVGSNSDGQTVIPYVKSAETVNDSTNFIARDDNGSLLIKTISSLWSYVQNKIDSVLKLSSSGYSGTAAVASKVKTVSTSTNAARYLTFVDSNNSSATEESVYTDAGIYYNPSTNAFTVSGNIKSSSGSISGSQVVIPTSKPVSPVAGSIWLS